jgi:hypothetical protein
MGATHYGTGLTTEEEQFSFSFPQTFFDWGFRDFRPCLTAQCGAHGIWTQCADIRAIGTGGLESGVEDGVPNDGQNSYNLDPSLTTDSTTTSPQAEPLATVFRGSMIHKWSPEEVKDCEDNQVAWSLSIDLSFQGIPKFPFEASFVLTQEIISTPTPAPDPTLAPNPTPTPPTTTPSQTTTKPSTTAKAIQTSIKLAVVDALSPEGNVYPVMIDGSDRTAYLSFVLRKLQYNAASISFSFLGNGCLYSDTTYDKLNDLMQPYQSLVPASTGGGDDNSGDSVTTWTKPAPNPAPTQFQLQSQDDGELGGSGMGVKGMGEAGEDTPFPTCDRLVTQPARTFCIVNGNLLLARVSNSHDSGMRMDSVRVQKNQNGSIWVPKSTSSTQDSPITDPVTDLADDDGQDDEPDDTTYFYSPHYNITYPFFHGYDYHVNCFQTVIMRRMPPETSQGPLMGNGIGGGSDDMDLLNDNNNTTAASSTTNNNNTTAPPQLNQSNTFQATNLLTISAQPLTGRPGGPSTKLIDLPESLYPSVTIEINTLPTITHPTSDYSQPRRPYVISPILVPIGAVDKTIFAQFHVHLNGNTLSAGDSVQCRFHDGINHSVFPRPFQIGDILVNITSTQRLTPHDLTPYRQFFTTVVNAHDHPETPALFSIRFWRLAPEIFAFLQHFTISLQTTDSIIETPVGFPYQIKCVMVHQDISVLGEKDWDGEGVVVGWEAVGNDDDDDDDLGADSDHFDVDFETLDDYDNGLKDHYPLPITTATTPTTNPQPQSKLDTVSFPRPKLGSTEILSRKYTTVAIAEVLIQAPFGPPGSVEIKLEPKDPAKEQQVNPKVGSVSGPILRQGLEQIDTSLPSLDQLEHPTPTSNQFAVKSKGSSILTLDDDDLIGLNDEDGEQRLFELLSATNQDLSPDSIWGTVGEIKTMYMGQKDHFLTQETQTTHASASTPAAIFTPQQIVVGRTNFTIILDQLDQHEFATITMYMIGHHRFGGGWTCSVESPITQPPLVKYFDATMTVQQGYDGLGLLDPLISSSHIPLYTGIVSLIQITDFSFWTRHSIPTSPTTTTATTTANGDDPHKNDDHPSPQAPKYPSSRNEIHCTSAFAIAQSWEEFFLPSYFSFSAEDAAGMKYSFGQSFTIGHGKPVEPDNNGDIPLGFKIYAAFSASILGFILLVAGLMRIRTWFRERRLKTFLRQNQVSGGGSGVGSGLIRTTGSINDNNSMNSSRAMVANGMVVAAHQGNAGAGNAMAGGNRGVTGGNGMGYGDRRAYQYEDEMISAFM